MSIRFPQIYYFVLTGLLIIGQPLIAIASDDWVLEKRFKEQVAEANSGDTSAMYEVGRMYERGRGIDEDVAMAMDWYHKAAKGGSSSAHTRLGMIYFTGHGAAQDYLKAKTHLAIGAKNNIPAAQYYLAMMYEKGHAVQQNDSTALTLYKKSAAGGYYQANSRIAKIQKSATKAKTVRLPAPPVAAKPSTKKLASGLVESVMRGDWQRNGKPAGYLPSAGTKCKKDGRKRYKCRSQMYSRKSDDTIITYVTMATLTGFSKKDKFDVTYQHNILRFQKDTPQEASQEEDDGEDYSIATTQSHGTLKLGAQRKKHKLNCVLKEERTLECIKNRTQKIEFNDRSGS